MGVAPVYVVAFTASYNWNERLVPDAGTWMMAVLPEATVRSPGSDSIFAGVPQELHVLNVIDCGRPEVSSATVSPIPFPWATFVTAPVALYVMLDTYPPTLCSIPSE